MVKADHMTAEEAHEYLKKQQKRTLERQQKFNEKQEAKGYKRLTTWMDAAGREALKQIKATDEQATNGDIISRSLIAYAKTLTETTEQSTQPINKPVKAKRKTVKADKQAIINRAAELQADGLPLAEISKALANEGMINRNGNPFDKAAISRMLKKRK